MAMSDPIKATKSDSVRRYYRDHIIIIVMHYRIQPTTTAALLEERKVESTIEQQISAFPHAKKNNANTKKFVCEKKRICAAAPQI